jgi:hypothetical protein
LLFFVLDWIAIQKEKGFLPKTIKHEILSVLQTTKIYEELWKLALVECKKKVDKEILECASHMYYEFGIE